MQRLWRVSAALLATAALIGLPAVASAGTYTATQNTEWDFSGWQPGTVTAGFFPCVPTGQGTPCGTLSTPHPLALVGAGAAAANGGGFYEWDAPAGVSLVSGTIALDWKFADPGTKVVVFTKAAGQQFSQWRTGSGTGSAHWAIPAGTVSLVVEMVAANAVTYPTPIVNRVNISQLSVSLSDASQASLTVTTLNNGVYPDNGPVCVTATAADAGSGVDSIALLDDSGAPLNTGYAIPSSTFQGATSSTLRLCAAPHALTDGQHTLHLVETNLGGVTTTRSVPVTVVPAS